MSNFVLYRQCGNTCQKNGNSGDAVPGKLLPSSLVIVGFSISFNGFKSRTGVKCQRDTHAHTHAHTFDNKSVVTG